MQDMDNRPSKKLKTLDYEVIQGEDDSDNPEACVSETENIISQPGCSKQVSTQVPTCSMEEPSDFEFLTNYLALHEDEQKYQINHSFVCGECKQRYETFESFNKHAIFIPGYKCSFSNKPIFAFSLDSSAPNIERLMATNQATSYLIIIHTEVTNSTSNYTHVFVSTSFYTIDSSQLMFEKFYKFMKREFYKCKKCQTKASNFNENLMDLLPMALYCNVCPLYEIVNASSRTIEASQSKFCKDYEYVCTICTEEEYIIKNSKNMAIHYYFKHLEIDGLAPSKLIQTFPPSECLCKSCQKTFPDRISLEKHFMTILESIYSCFECHTIFHSQADHENHDCVTGRK